MLKIRNLNMPKNLSSIICMQWWIIKIVNRKLILQKDITYFRYKTYQSQRNCKYMFCKTSRVEVFRFFSLSYCDTTCKVVAFLRSLIAIILALTSIDYAFLVPYIFSFRLKCEISSSKSMSIICYTILAYIFWSNHCMIDINLW